MADARLGVAEASTPTHYVDNESVTNDAGQAALRQKVSAPSVEQLLFEILDTLQSILRRSPLPNPGTAAQRTELLAGTASIGNVGTISTVTTCSTVTTVTTCSTVTTCASLTNQVNVGGYNAVYQVPALMRLVANTLRDRISVS